jgi:HEPN domain-containing protein
MTSNVTPVPGSPADWLRHARSDLSLAATAPPAGVLYEALCYHAQQASEKALKAVILQVTKHEPPFTHSLRRLTAHVARAGVQEPVPLTAESAALLTQYAVIRRYPADVGEIDEAEWRRAVEHSRAVLEWAEALIHGKEGA